LAFIISHLSKIPNLSIGLTFSNYKKKKKAYFFPPKEREIEFCGKEVDEGEGKGE
jgi:hypothetical protein